MQEECKQLPAVVHTNDTPVNLNLTSDYSSEEAVVVNVCAPILFLAGLQDDEEIGARLDEIGVDRDALNASAEQALDMFRSFMGFNEE